MPAFAIDENIPNVRLQNLREMTVQIRRVDDKLTADR